MRRAVFLDRDGVINPLVYNPELGFVDSPSNAGQFRLFPNAAAAVQAINRMGFAAIVVSNQPGIAKGKFTPAILDKMTRKMHEDLTEGGAALDNVYYCLHHPEAALEAYRTVCDCRKPAPGLLLRAAHEWDIDLARSYMIGDGVPDIAAGNSAGCSTVFLSERKCDICTELFRRNARPDYFARDLEDAVRVIQEIESGGRPRCACDETFTTRYLGESLEILRKLDRKSIERVLELLAAVRERAGRVFFLGVGGGAANASHAVNDFRKIAGLEAYAPSDNVSELTARTNDEGWESVYVDWLRGSRLSAADLVFVFSVGGGSPDRRISVNIVRALEYARETGSAICGVVGRDGGYTAKVADAAILVPVVNPDMVTPHTESIQALLTHLLVSHPALKSVETKWESAQPVRF